MNKYLILILNLIIFHAYADEYHIINPNYVVMNKQEVLDWHIRYKKSNQVQDSKEKKIVDLCFLLKIELSFIIKLIWYGREDLNFQSHLREQRPQRCVSTNSTTTACAHVVSNGYKKTCNIINSNQKSLLVFFT